MAALKWLHFLLAVTLVGLWLAGCAPAPTPEEASEMSEPLATSVREEKQILPASPPAAEVYPTQALAAATPGEPPPAGPAATPAPQSLQTESVVKESPGDEVAISPSPFPTTTFFPSPEFGFTAPSPIPENRQVQVAWPPRVRLGESDIVRLSLIPSLPGYVLVTEFPDQSVITQTLTVTPLQGYELFAVARLDGVSFLIAPQGDQVQFLTQGQPLEWRWSISPQASGSHRLSLALRLRWVPTAAATPLREVAAYSTALDVRVTSFLGLTQPQAFLSGLLGLIFGGSLSLFALVIRPRPTRSLPSLREQLPNPSLAIELPAGLHLSKQENTLLQSLFHRYARLVIEQEFLSGYSGARTFLTLPIRADGRADAYTIAKLGEKASIRKEYANYEEFVKDTLPPVTARIQRPPVQLPSAFKHQVHSEKIELAALQYTFIGEPGDTPISLRKYLQSQLNPAILNKLLHTFGPNWWLQRKPYTFRLGQEYDRTLPTHFVVEPASGQGRRLDGGASPDADAYRVGEIITLHNFPIIELRRDGRSLSLQGRSPAGSPPLRVRWLSLHRPEGATGRIVATRHTLLSQIVSGCDLFGLPDPLDRLPELLGETISGSQSIIHGDLNLENILVGPGELLWLIDFAQTREGHTLFDFAHLEAELIAHLLAAHISSSTEYLSLLQNPHASPYQPLVALCAVIQDITKRGLFNPSQPREYRLALAVTCLGALKFANLDTHARHLLYLTSAFLLS